jgi:hypothetical protein
MAAHQDCDGRFALAPTTSDGRRGRWCRSAQAEGVTMPAQQAWPPRLAQEARLRGLDALVAGDGEPLALDAIERRIERAALLHAVGQPEAARQAYLDVLSRAPTHFGALNDFGVLLSTTGFRAAARTVHAEAVRHHPDNPMGHVNLALALYRAGEFDEARRHYETALRLDGAHPQAHQGLGNVLAALGDHDGAERHHRAGYGGRAVTTLPYRGSRPPVPVLLLVSAAGGDVPAAQLLDDRTFLTSVAVADFCDPQIPLPPHRVVFNAIGDADLCARALETARTLLDRTFAPVINRPAAVLGTSRTDNARRLAIVPGVVAPRIVRMPRQSLLEPGGAALVTDQGLGFPLLLRTPGCHTGQHFERVERADDLGIVAAELPGDELLAIEPLDARGPDGKTRKYRVMIINGVIYPLHLAVSRHWKVHYFTADMADVPEHRAEDAAFLADMAGTLGSKAMAALDGIRRVLDLDYAGIDFGLGPDGDVLLFEANATMVVPAPDDDPRWAYRRPAETRILDAARGMIAARAGASLQP